MSSDFGLAADSLSKAWNTTTHYERHILPVVLQAEIISDGAGLAQTEKGVVEAIAKLYDILEQTACKMDYIKELHRVPDAVFSSVAVLTKAPNTMNSVYLTEICGHSIYTVIVALAVELVKFRDILCEINSNTEKLVHANNINHLTTALVRKIEGRKK